jgi:hypothetical protein
MRMRRMLFRKRLSQFQKVCQLSSISSNTDHSKAGSWLLHLTTWRIKDQFRQREKYKNPQLQACEKQENAEPASGPVTSEFEEMWENEYQDCVWHAALERVKKKVSPIAFQVFDAIVLQEWELKKVAGLLKVNRDTFT